MKIPGFTLNTYFTGLPNAGKLLVILKSVSIASNLIITSVAFFILAGTEIALLLQPH
jgi:hypothetical protein